MSERIPLILISLFCFLNLSRGALSSTSSLRSCSPGTYNNGTVCLKCPAGTYQTEPNRNSSCIKCPSGTANPFVGAGTDFFCLACPWPFNPPAGSAECNPCPKGFTQANTGKCLRCKPGTFVASSSCQKCPRGEYSTKFNSEYCSSCPENKVASSDRTKCIVPDCPPGFRAWSTTGECQRCYYHTLPDGSRSSCDRCPQRYVYPTNSSICTLCSPGTFASFAFDTFSTTYCENCGNGSTTIGYGKAACKTKGKPCPKGTFLDVEDDCDSCSIEEYRDVKENRCKPCPPGQYGHGGLRTSCTPCLPGQDFNGFFTSSPWTHVCSCPGGTVVQNGRCTPCPKGTFNSGDFMDFCQNCDYNSFADKPGSTACKQCPKGTSSLSTNGTFCAKLESCPKGFVYPQSRSHYGCVSLINGCPMNMTLKGYGDSNNTVCTRPNGKPWCPPGTVFRVDDCHSCPEGFYLETYDGSDYTTCEPCYGYSRGGTSFKCKYCSSGYFGRDGQCICQGTLYINEYGNCVSCKGFVAEPFECQTDSYYFP